jgi:hypothetical protein
LPCINALDWRFCHAINLPSRQAVENALITLY